MGSRKLIFGIAILAFIFIGTAVGKSHKHKRKTDTETDSAQELRVLDHDLSHNSTSGDIVKLPDNITALNATNSTQDSKQAKKALRLKHRREHHKRKHEKRARKNKRRSEKEANRGHELSTVGITGDGNTGDSKEVPQQRVRNHHHKKSDKHHQRQQRRLHRRKKLHSHREELSDKSSDGISGSVGP